MCVCCFDKVNILFGNLGQINCLGVENESNLTNWIMSMGVQGQFIYKHIYRENTVSARYGWTILGELCMVLEYLANLKDETNMQAI